MSIRRFVDKHATATLLVSVFLGIVFPKLPPVFSPYLGPFVWFLLFVILVRSDWGETIVVIKRAKLTVLVGIWLFLVSPGVVWLVGRHLITDPVILAAIVLWAASPPLMASPALSRFAGLDASLSLGLLLLMTLVAPFVMPVVVLVFLDIGLEVGVGEMSFRLTLFIGSAVFSAAATRRFVAVPTRQRAESMMDLSLLVVLVLFAIGIVDGVTNRFTEDPAHVLGILGIAVALIFSLQVVGTVAFMFLGRLPALTIGYSSGMRNMILLLGAMPAVLHPDILLFLALVQFPVYIGPALLKPVVRRLARTEDGMP